MSIHDSIALVAAAGFDADRMDHGQVYLLAGKIINDRELTKRAEKYIRNRILPAGSRVKTINAMSEMQRELLRLRVQ